MKNAENRKWNLPKLEVEPGQISVQNNAVECGACQKGIHEAAFEKAKPKAGHDDEGIKMIQVSFVRSSEKEIET